MKEIDPMTENNTETLVGKVTDPILAELLQEAVCATHLENDATAHRLKCHSRLGHYLATGERLNDDTPANGAQGRQ